MPRLHRASLRACVGTVIVVVLILSTSNGPQASDTMYQDADSCSGIITLERFCQLVDPVL